MSLPPDRSRRRRSAKGRRARKAPRYQPPTPRSKRNSDALLQLRQRRRQRGQRQARARHRVDAWHQVRNALTTLTLQAELAVSTTDDADRRSIVFTMRDRLAQLQRYLNDREAQASRQQAGSVVPRRSRHAKNLPIFDLRQLVHQVVAEWWVVASRQGIRLQFEAGNNEPLWAHGHADALREALGNVVANAIEHTPSGGKVLLSVTAPSPTHLSVRVSDSGRGVAQKYRRRIFYRKFRDPLHCTAESAIERGVGLDLVYRIVLESRGKTEVCEVLPSFDGGVGLTVVITLGRAKSAADCAAQQHKN